MIVLDTTVLVYAVGATHALREPSRALLTAVGSGPLQATTTVAVIQEFAHVRGRRQGREDAAILARAYADLLSPLLPVTRPDLERGLSLWQRHERLGAFDAVLAAAASGAGAEALVSADRAFESVAEPAVVPLRRAAAHWGLG